MDSPAMARITSASSVLCLRKALRRERGAETEMVWAWINGSYVLQPGCGGGKLFLPGKKEREKLFAFRGIISNFERLKIRRTF